MNEQLEKLKNQAVDYAGEVFEYHGKDYREIVMEKFAELIVRECAGVVFKKTGPKSALDVLEHFGVEE